MEYQVELVPEKHMARVKLIIDNKEDGEKWGGFHYRRRVRDVRRRGRGC